MENVMFIYGSTTSMLQCHFAILCASYDAKLYSFLFYNVVLTCVYLTILYVFAKDESR